MLRLTSSGGTCAAGRSHPLGNINQFHSSPVAPLILDFSRHKTTLSRLNTPPTLLERVGFPLPPQDGAASLNQDRRAASMTAIREHFMQKNLPILALGALLTAGAALPGVAFSQAVEPVVAEISGSQLAGEVMVVNTETRLMTLKDADGVFHVCTYTAVSRIDRDQDRRQGDDHRDQQRADLANASRRRNAARHGYDHRSRAGRGRAVTRDVSVSGKIVALIKEAAR